MKAAWLMAGALFYTSAASAAPLSDSPFAVEGVGVLKIGMTQKEAEDATGYTITLWENATEGCDTGALGDTGIIVMIEKGVITRLSVSGKEVPYTTTEGVKVGDDENNVLALYKEHLNDVAMNNDNTEHGYYFSELIIRSHTYDDNGHYLLIRASNDMGYMFETDGTVITDIHAGKYDSVGYIEGCL